MPSSDEVCGSIWAERQSPLPPSLIASRSKPVRCVAMSAATMEQKKCKGENAISRVDTVGLLLAVKVLSAHIRDRAGGKILLEPLRGKIPRLQLIWADSGYEGAPFSQWVQETLGVRVEITKHPWTGLRGVWVPPGVEVDWDKIIPKGFHILPKRWIVERTNAWVSHCRRLARDYEGTFSSSEAFIFLALSKIMLARLARFSP